MKALRTPALMIVAAIAGAYLWDGMSDAPAAPQVFAVSVPVVAPPSAQAAETDAAIASPLGRSISAPSAPAAPENTLSRKLFEVRDVKVFVEDALRPENVARGGAYQAHRALVLCDGGLGEVVGLAGAAKARIVVATSTLTSESEKMIEDWPAKCANLTAEEVALYRVRVNAHRLDGSDPAFALLRARAKTTFGSPERKAAVDAIYATRDLALIETVAPAGFEFLLGVCVPGEYCGLDGFMWATSWETGERYASREDFALQVLFKGDQAAFDQAMQVAERTRAAIARGERPTFR
jgi:hypothetical protein